jgi:hypothetical protein
VLIETQVNERPALDTRVQPHVRIIGGALDEDPNSPTGLILQGRIDQNTLRFLHVDQSYQRPPNKRDDIFDALRAGTVVPPIDIGVRGQDFEMNDDDFVIRIPAFVIDGGQRIAAAKRLLDNIPNAIIRMFAIVHFGSTPEWEARRFDNLNKNVVKVSGDIHLRNIRSSNNAILTLFGLSNSDKEFPLYRRVCWSQNMQRGELLKAGVLAKTSVLLHQHHAGLRQAGYDAAAECAARIASIVSLPTFRRNVSTFFYAINECWPFAAISHQQKAVQIKGSFLAELARMFANHPIFWDESGHTLVLSADDRRKLAAFPISDPQIVNLAGSSGTARKMLYQLLVNHMNSGRRTNRLVER